MTFDERLELITTATAELSSEAYRSVYDGAQFEQFQRAVHELERCREVMRGMEHYIKQPSVDPSSSKEV